MDLPPASGFPIRFANLPVRIGAIEIVNVDERDPDRYRPGPSLGLYPQAPPNTCQTINSATISSRGEDDLAADTVHTIL